MITGFTKTKSSGTFDQTEIDAIFAEIKTRLSAFNVQESTPTVVRFGPSGSTPGQDTDDTPFYRCENSATDGVVVQAYVGVTGGAMGTQATVYNSFEPVLKTGVRNTVHFACSPSEGWWWIAADDSSSSSSGRFIAGCGFSRVAHDMTTGLQPRFGLLMGDYDGILVRLPYATIYDGSVATSPSDIKIYAASPMGVGRATRHTGSQLPKGIAPMYPATSKISGVTPLSPAIFGDADCAMMATDGFSWGEEAAPGWRVFARTGLQPEDNYYVALRSPATFDVLA